MTSQLSESLTRQLGRHYDQNPRAQAALVASPANLQAAFPPPLRPVNGATTAVVIAWISGLLLPVYGAYTAARRREFRHLLTYFGVCIAKRFPALWHAHIHI